MTLHKVVWLSLILCGVLALAPSLADARAGGSQSSGSRGSRTFEAPPATSTAPQAKPMERSATPQQAQRPAATTPAAQPQGFFQRHPFMSGLLGGMLGAGLFGMLVGGGFLGGLGDMSGVLGLLMQLLLIGGLVYLAVRFIRRKPWQAGALNPAYAYASNHPQAGLVDESRMTLPPSSGAAGLTNQLSVGEADYKAFEKLLMDVQTAYSTGEVSTLRRLATPEMSGYFAEQLAADASQGVENKIEDVKFEQGDLSEAWSEGDLDYATVAMRFSMLDVTKRRNDGRIVAGSDKERVEATEFWTFLRSRGAIWQLSAVQQTG